MPLSKSSYKESLQGLYILFAAKVVKVFASEELGHRTELQTAEQHWKLQGRARSSISGDG
jgi:hypothetical protein